MSFSCMKSFSSFPYSWNELRTLLVASNLVPAARPTSPPSTSPSLLLLHPFMHPRQPCFAQTPKHLLPQGICTHQPSCRIWCHLSDAHRNGFLMSFRSLLKCHLREEQLDHFSSILCPTLLSLKALITTYHYVSVCPFAFCLSPSIKI